MGEYHPGHGDTVSIYFHVILDKNYKTNLPKSRLSLYYPSNKGIRAVITREPRTENDCHPELVPGSIWIRFRIRPGMTKASRPLREFPSQNQIKYPLSGGTFPNPRDRKHPYFVMGAFFMNENLTIATLYADIREKVPHAEFLQSRLIYRVQEIL